METYADQAAKLYREAADVAGTTSGNARADRILRAAEGLTALAAIEKGLLPPLLAPTTTPAGDPAASDSTARI
jgi:hypothetical protein